MSQLYLLLIAMVSLPLGERGLKCTTVIFTIRLHTSLPLGERGLKYYIIYVNLCQHCRSL